MIPQSLTARLLAATAALSTLAIPASVSADTQTTSGTQMTNTQEAASLIPRDALFGNPTKAQGRLSPDGKYLSWLAPKDGVLNIWVAPRDNVDAAKAMTSATDRPIRSHFWSGDSKSVAYIQDKGG
ncbi:MAG: S9 family peptidase, partial [Pseudomonadota bacterium]